MMIRRTFIALLLFSCALPSVALADWPMYRGNAARTGYTGQSLPADLSLSWSYQSAHAPRPAWPRSDRMPFDRAHHTVIGGGMVIFGSSVEGKVHALDANTGWQVWSYFTDGPIRFAPALWNDRLFVASDDGYLYALAIADGRLLWKKQGAPENGSILGNERMISKWPARGGPAVVDDVVYFAAGIWPSEGIHLYALDAATGEPRWVNDESGQVYMAQPHGGANAKSGVSAQGYLVASGDHLLVPTGRAIPASFDRRSGKMQFFHLQKYGHNGGAPTMAVGDMFFNSGLSFSAQTGERVTAVGSGQLVATSDGLVRADASTVGGFKWIDVEKPDRKGKLVKTKALEPLWSVRTVGGGASLIVTGDKVVSGGDGLVQLIDPKAQKVVWSSKVDGVAYGLAASDGKLLVSTDRGTIYCFDAGGVETARPRRDEPSAAPYGDNRDYAKAAEEIIRRTGVTEGFCLDLGCGDGRLAYELAKRTNLQIYAVDGDAENVALARDKLVAAGLYGRRVTVHHRDPAMTGYPKYFADLIVSGRSVAGGPRVIAQAEAERVQRPFGGMICVGRPGAMQSTSRAALAGAGRWTHQYCDAANTLCSDDRLVKGRLGMLWFRDVDFDVPQRHGRAPAPLSDQGRLFHEGINGITAVDAYNGRELWRYEIPGVLHPYNGDQLMGTAGTGSNFCLGGGSVYVRDGKRCLRLEAATGRLLAELPTPNGPDGAAGTWGYIAFQDGTLYGSVADEEHVVAYRYVNRGGDMARQWTESHSLFAIAADTGQIKWHYQAENSIRHNAIAVTGGKVFLIDRPLALFDRQKKSETKEHPTGTLVALDAESGEVLWRQNEDIYGTLLAVGVQHGVLLMSYQPTRFRLDSEIGGRMTAYLADNGKRLWDVKADYQSRPIINGRTVYAQGGAWDLVTGESRPFNFSRSYGCGILAGSRNMMFFRSATLGYFDLTKNYEMTNYGGVRPGCWVNAIPAGGVVLVPDASAGCQCSYLNKAWFALHPVE